MWKNQESWHRDFSHLEEIKHWLRFHSGRQQNDAKRNRKWDRTNTSRPGHHRECEKAATCWIRRNSSPVVREQNSPTFAYLTDNLQCKHPHPTWTRLCLGQASIHYLTHWIANTAAGVWQCQLQLTKSEGGMQSTLKCMFLDCRSKKSTQKSL